MWRCVDQAYEHQAKSVVAMLVQVNRSTSLSHHPFLASHWVLIHKIGVTGGKVESRHRQCRTGLHPFADGVFRIGEVSST